MLLGALIAIVLLLSLHLTVTILAVRALLSFLKQPLRAPLHGPRAPLQ